MLRAEKFDFTGHPYAKQMIQTSVFDYYPQDKNGRQPAIVPDNIPEDCERDMTARRQTENSETRKYAGEDKNAALHQTETKNNRARGCPPAKKPPQGIKPNQTPGTTAIPKQKPAVPECAAGIRQEPSAVNTEPGIASPCQTDLELMTSGSCPHVPAENTPLCQTEIEIADDLAHQGEILALSQTETKSNQKRGARRANNTLPTEPDYEKLLDSFKQPPAKPPGQPKPKSSAAAPDKEMGITEDELLSTPPDEAPQSQSGCMMPLISTAIRIDPVDDSAGSILLGAEYPPSDF